MHIGGTTIIAGLDGSQRATAAAHVAADLARRSDSRFQLALVLDEQLESPERQDRLRWIHDEVATAIHREHRITVHRSVVYGFAPDELAAAVDSSGAGLLVLGSSHHMGLSRVLMGNTVDGVIYQVSCPVLVVREDYRNWPPLHVVIGDDASEEAELAGEFAVEIASLCDAGVTLVEAEPAIPLHRRTSDLPWVASIKDNFENRLTQRAADLGKLYGHRIGTRLVTGPAAASLIKAAESGEARRTLIAVGTKCLSGLARLRHPSVSREILQLASGPVLICPIGTEEFLGRERRAKHLVTH